MVASYCLPNLSGAIDPCIRQSNRLQIVPPLGQEAAKDPPALEHVFDLRRVRSRMVVGRVVQVPVDVLVGSPESEGGLGTPFEIGRRQLLHLMGGIPGFEVGAQSVTLDRLRQHHRRPAIAHRCRM